MEPLSNNSKGKKKEEMEVFAFFFFGGGVSDVYSPTQPILVSLSVAILVVVSDGFAIWVVLRVFCILTPALEFLEFLQFLM